jgi:hypothetical protein
VSYLGVELGGVPAMGGVAELDLRRYVPVFSVSCSHSHPYLEHSRRVKPMKRTSETLPSRSSEASVQGEPHGRGLVDTPSSVILLVKSAEPLRYGILTFVMISPSGEP